MIDFKFKEKGIVKNEESGITLMALVVTIIILLILAGISIGMLSGDNSIIKQAGNAKTQTDIAQEKEILEQATVVTMGKSKYGNVEKQYLDSELNKYPEIDGSEDVDDGIEVTFKSGRVYLVDADGDVSEVVIVDRSGINVGDYVNYVPDVPSSTVYPHTTLNTYSGSANNTENIVQDTLNWQVLRIYRDGSLDIIGSITSQDIYFQGSKGYTYGVYLMDDICKTLYSRTLNSIEARSVDLEDFEYWLKQSTSGIEARAECELYGHAKYGESITYTKNNKYPPFYKQQTSLSDPGSLLLSSDFEENDSLTVTETCYQIDINETNYSNGFKVLYNNPTSSWYWVATRSSQCHSSSARFGLHAAGPTFSAESLCISTGNPSGESSTNLRLRPVIHLKSSVQITPKSGTTSEPHEISDYGT